VSIPTGIAVATGDNDSSDVVKVSRRLNALCDRAATWRTKMKMVLCSLIQSQQIERETKPNGRINALRDEIKRGRKAR
jgi:hypothetical protein